MNKKIIRYKLKETIEKRDPTAGTDTIRFGKKATKLFKEKLLEEITELIEAKTPNEIIEESADVIQVIKDYAKLNNIVYGKIIAKLSIKAEALGGFISDKKTICTLELKDK